MSRAYLSSFVGAVLKNLSSLEDNSTPTARKLVDRKLLRRMKKSLLATRLVLDDAEQKQIGDEEVKKWLIRLQDALYMADDLLDELSTKVTTATPPQTDQGNNSSYFRSVVDSQIEDSDDDEMEDIVDKLEDIVEEKDAHGLKPDLAKDLEDISWRIQSSLPESSLIYGRDEEKEEIIRFLLEEAGEEDKLSVISIEGLGGIGKTTLAQFVYNDAKVKQKFNLRAWACVATTFNPENVTKSIIEDITSSSCNLANTNSLQTQLREKLTNKTFLIVLDDVWNNERDLWDKFLKPFLSGNKGSKILLTTRNKNVDSVVPTTNRHYQLNLLSPNDCWSVFLKHSSISTNSDQYATLEQIGRKIVEKCKGLPLAVKTLGGLLHNKYNVDDWETILKSEFWELPEGKSKVNPALRVSYHYLPSDLKRCFVYCSLFPQDYQFDKDELILLWMAEDLLQPERNKSLENIGCERFNELVARSFFQSSSADAGIFVMHDLMHDIATFFAGEFFFREFEISHKINDKTRHLSYNRDPVSIFREAPIYVRTFLGVQFQPNNVEDDFLLEQIMCLRVLSFQKFQIRSLPNKIGELIHLRFLNLSETPIVTLPESLCELHNLQTLKLSSCHKLEMLPSRMQDLVNLRHLDIRGTYRLKEMPKGMSKLKHLNLLGQYIVGKHEENGIRELGPLDVHGSFCISNLENVNSSREALEAKMGDKKHIHSLVLRWLRDGEIVDAQAERDILDKLQPDRKLKELSILGYRGKIFPDWLGLRLSCYSNMTKLRIFGCKNCDQLPSLGQLPSLQHLEIFGLDKLEKIGSEFYKNGDSSHDGIAFRSLESLAFYRIHGWQEWYIPDEFNGFPRLKRLSIEDCPVFRGDLPAYLPALEQLTILMCEELACSLPRAPNLQELLVS